MKYLTFLAALVWAAAPALAQAGKPINDTCPVKGNPVKGITTTYKGKTIGFC